MRPVPNELHVPTLDHLKHVVPFTQVASFESEDGYVVWRRGTGDNVELLHLRSYRPGAGTRLLRVMLTRLKDDPPYATVFGFCLRSNPKAQEFYLRQGFTLSFVTGVYAEGEAVVFSARYDDLCRRHEL
jgi:hypothetical protein